MNNFNFVKMNCLGNDFVIINRSDLDFEISPQFAKQIAQRHTGVGCDQILLFESVDKANNIFDFQIFNADGSQSEQCGNGAICTANLIYDRQYANAASSVMLRTSAADMRCHLSERCGVSAELGIPTFIPSEIPFLADDEQIQYELSDVKVDGKPIQVCVLAIGNPHAVTLVSDADAAAVRKVGRKVESHRRFPHRVNVEFMQVVSRERIYLRVFERGVGETWACGSGSSAAVAAGRRLGLLDESVTVKVKAGEVGVNWKGPGTPVSLTAPASYVFEGRWGNDIAAS